MKKKDELMEKNIR